MSDRVDMGQRVFLAGFFTPFALGPALAVVGFGQTGSPWIALAALVNVVLLVSAAQFLYAGYRKMEWIVWIAGVVFLGLAIATLVSGQSPPAYYLAAQFLMPVLFAAAVATPAARAFLANHRGEASSLHDISLGSVGAASIAGEPTAVKGESILETSADGVGFTLREELKRPALNYARALRLAAGLLVLCMLGGVVAGVFSILSRGSGLALIFAAVLSMPPAFVLLALADDWYFLATTKGYGKAHLTNIVKDSQACSTCVTACIAMLALVAILGAALR